MSRALSLLCLLAACGPSPEDIATNLGSVNPAVREDSAKIARNAGSDEVVAALIAVLDDDSEQVRLNAVDSLIELEATDAVPRLIVLIENDPSEDVRKEAVDALGRLGDKSAVEPLIAYVEAREADPPLNAIWALGYLEDMRALDVLSRLRKSTDLYVAYNANQALRKIHP